MSSEFDQENLISIFVTEASDGMKALAEVLNSADDGFPLPQQLQEQFIIAHRIKGAAALYGYDGVARLCERLEALCENATALSEAEWPWAVGVMRELVQGIEEQVQAIGNGGCEDQTAVERCLASSSSLLTDMPNPADSLLAEQGVALEYVVPSVDPEALSYFVPEAKEYLSVIEGVISELRANPAKDGVIHLFCLTAHTLNAAASTVGFQVIGDIAGKIEQCLSAAQEGGIPLGGELLDAFAHAASLIRLLLRREAAASGRLQHEVPGLIGTLGRYCDKAAIGAPSFSASEPISPPEATGAEIPTSPISDPSGRVFTEASHGGGLAKEDAPGMPASAEESSEESVHSSDDNMAGENFTELCSSRSEESVTETGGGEALTEVDAIDPAVSNEETSEPPACTVSDPTAPDAGPEYVSLVIEAEACAHFASEAEELLSEVEGLTQILCLDGTGDAIRCFTHATHTLKGLADGAGFQAVGDLVQKMEACMNAVLDQHIPLSSELLDAVSHAVSLIRLLIQRDADAIEPLLPHITGLIGILSRLCDQPVVDELPSSVSEATASAAVSLEGAVGAIVTASLSSRSEEAVTETEGAEALTEVDAIDSAVSNEETSEPPARTVSDPATPDTGSEYVVPVIDDEVLSYFVPEAEEYLATIERVIPTLRADVTDEDAIHRLFRATHTLKGSAYTVEFQVIGDIAQPMEDCMIAVRERRIPVTSELLDAFGLAASLVRLLLQRDVTAVEQLQSDVPALISILSRLCDGQANVEQPGIVSASDSRLAEENNRLQSEAAEPATSVFATHLSQSDDYFLPQLDPEVLSYFVPEAVEYLETLEANLLRLDKDPQNRELINQLFRTAHTLKGSAYMVGFQAIGDLIHHVEDFMGAVRDSRLTVMPGYTDLILRTVDVVHALMRRNPSAVDNTRQRFQAALSELRQLEQDHAVEAVPIGQFSGGALEQSERVSGIEEDEGRAGKQAEGRRGEEREVIRVSYARLEQLMNLVGELVIGRGRLEQRLRMLERLSDEVLACKARMIDCVQSFADKHTFSVESVPTGPKTQPATQGARGFGGFGALELDKYDDFNILARRIGEVSADIAEAMAQLSGSIQRAQEDMNALQQLTRTMRDEIGRARMVPIGTPFTRFRRAIREIARALDKQVSLVTSGEHTEVDTGIVEGLVDPLVHLIRNAVYHGIESPAERVAKGKPPVGTIYLYAAHRGNSIVVEVEDDGAGLDLAKIREKAAAVGLVPRDQVQAMPDDEALQVIFAPGFSTVEKAGDQAGRGVGLDVVKRAIEGMNGHIQVESQPGIGTKFSLSLPLTLLITTALLVRAGTERYAITLSNIREVTLPTAMSIQRTDDRTLLYADEEVIEVQSLRRLLHQEHHSESMAMPIVIVRTATGLLGLAVDELLGRQEIVIKTLGSLKPFARSCFAGATIDPEGKVILVIDPARLEMRQSTLLGGDSTLSPGIASPIESAVESAKEERGNILLIDDSLSIRKFVGRMLESAGYPVDTAVDGDDGIRKASETAYRIVITDLEMPKFNGYEVVQALRARPQTRQTPIIVMTTRAGDKHRQLALDVGANSYIAKPVDERTLLSEVERLAGILSAKRE